MHHQAISYVAQFSTDATVKVLDIGGRDVNGTCRPLFPRADYLAVDLRDGPGVDIVADVTTWNTRRRFDLVVCTEVLEHCPDWQALVVAAAKFLRRGGRLILTAAGPGRAPHSAHDGGNLRAGEHYANIEPAELAAVLGDLKFQDIDVRHVGEDVQATAVK